LCSGKRKKNKLTLQVGKRKSAKVIIKTGKEKNSTERGKLLTGKWDEKKEERSHSREVNVKKGTRSRLSTKGRKGQRAWEKR